MVKYNSQRARQISGAVGKILCLHGTSSVNPGDLFKLPLDGFVKINVYTTLAVNGGQALTRKTLANLGNIFTKKQLNELVEQNILNPAVLSEEYGETQGQIKPKLVNVANPPRRDAWFHSVRNRCYDFLEIFNYNNFSH